MVIGGTSAALETAPPVAARTYVSYVRAMARMKATQLRVELFRVLDRILETGEEVEIERNGQLLRLAPKKAVRGWDRLVERPDAVNGDPDELVGLGWLNEWKP